eukprot:5897131-Amphidinium_carterae.1
MILLKLCSQWTPAANGDCSVLPDDQAVEVDVQQLEKDNDIRQCGLLYLSHNSEHMIWRWLWVL